MNKTPETVSRFFLAMQSGATAEPDMAALLAEDAVYIEPFSGEVKTHSGRERILETMRAGWKWNPPDMTIEIDNVTVERSEIVARWTCRASNLPGGEGKGVNRFTLRDGLIVRLETRLLA